MVILSNNNMIISLFSGLTFFSTEFIFAHFCLAQWLWTYGLMSMIRAIIKMKSNPLRKEMTW